MSDQTPRGLAFATRMRPMRALGSGLGAIAVASGLLAAHAGASAWVLLVLHCFGWPHLAHALALRSRDPAEAEFRNLQLDAAFGGAWVAAMGFNLLPSVLILSMLWMGEIGAGGLRLLLRSLLLQVLGAAVLVLVAGLRYAPVSGMLQVAACIPFLVIYPLAMSLLVRSLSRRVTRQNSLLELANRTDALTGLSNRQHFELVAAAECERARTAQQPATLVMLDLDGFKTVNDRDGHLAGDAMLAAIAAVLRESVRSMDTPGRYAGDEFAVVLPGAPLEIGIDVAERIRARVDALRVGETRRRCTVSIGVAALDGTMRDVRDWMHAADQALYVSKRTGRNRVCTAQGVVALRRSERSRG